ncbi:hsp70-binding protein 1-like [Ixodes scapularis]|uniref:hsp70-binding protein 1-like n=1 Tax=Ixodes scapularis TaxID=6945 RepID=UPI001A9F2CA7|nr:hsp70-binding protein 1-like [Ixodes scapularis]
MDASEHPQFATAMEPDLPPLMPALDPVSPPLMAAINPVLPALMPAVDPNRPPRISPMDRGHPQLPSAIDPDRIHWLMEATNRLLVNPYDEMRRSLQSIRECLQESENIARVLVSCLSNVARFVDFVDYAKDFEKMGGFQVVPALLDYPSASAREATCSLIAELVQNNPHCQRAAVLSLRKLLRLVEHETDEDVRLKSLYAVSCMVRQNRQAFEKFQQLGGTPVVRSILFHCESEKLKTKASFLVAALCSQEESFRSDLEVCGFVRDAVALLPRIHGTCREFLLRAMFTLASNSPQFLEATVKDALESTLQTLVHEHRGIQQFQEEVEYSEKLLNIVRGVST